MYSNNDLMDPNWKPTDPDEFTIFMNAKKVAYNMTHDGTFNTVHVTEWAHEYVKKIEAERNTLKVFAENALQLSQCATTREMAKAALDSHNGTALKDGK